jgi:DNA-binding transcriptional LysR family regulator
MLLLPALAAGIQRTAPGVVLRLRDTSIGDVVRRLREDTIDLAIEPALEPQEGVSSQTLFPSPFRVIAAKGHPALAAAGVASDATIPIGLYCSLPHALRSVDGGLTGPVDAALAAVGHRRRVVLTLPQFEAVAHSVAGGGYLAALPAQFAEAAARRLPLEIYRAPVEAPAAEVQMLWHARHDAEPSHEWLRDRVVACVSELGFAGQVESAIL